MKHVDIFTDGACSGNPGPGGWGAVLRYGEKEKELCGGEAETTNNRMELLAAITALSKSSKVDLAGFPNVAAWLDRALGRPSYNG